MLLSPTTEKEDDGSTLLAQVENFTLGIVVKTNQNILKYFIFQLHIRKKSGTDSLWCKKNPCQVIVYAMWPKSGIKNHYQSRWVRFRGLHAFRRCCIQLWTGTMEKYTVLWLFNNLLLLEKSVFLKLHGQVTVTSTVCGDQSRAKMFFFNVQDFISSWSLWRP